MIDRDRNPLSAFRFMRGLPRESLLVDLQGPGEKPPRLRRKALVCGELLTQMSRRLRARGVALTSVSSAPSALGLLADEAFDVVVLDAAWDRGGLELAKALKLGEAAFDVAPEVLSKAVARHQNTPIVVLPLEGSTEFAVIVRPPQIGILEDTTNVSLEDAIVRLDVRKLILAGDPVA